MKVEVGDWVKMRGQRRIYEVSEVLTEKVFRVHGAPATRHVANVEKIAPKFWIRKERMR